MNPIKASKFAGCDLSALKEILRNIDRDEDPDFFDEIHTLIVGKEFGEIADEIKEEEGIVDVEPEPEEEEEFHMGIYNSYELRELKALLRKTSKKDKPKFYDELQTLIVTREFGNMSKSVGRIPSPNTTVSRGGISETRSTRRVGGSGLYTK